MRIHITNFFTSFLSVFVLFILVFSHNAAAQNDTIYYDAKWKTTVKDSAAYFRPPSKKIGEVYKKEDFYMSGALQMSGLSSSLDKDLWEGTVTWYNEDGGMLQQGNYKNNRLDGEYISTLAGKKIKAQFKNGKMVSGKTNNTFNNGRQYYTEMRGDTIVNTIYDKDIEGARYERYNVGKQYDVLIKYYDYDGKFMGQREPLSEGYIKGITVSYYKTPMRPMEVKYYKNGIQLGSTFYYCEDQVREEFSWDNELSKTFYSPKGEFLGKVNYVYDNNYLKPTEGTEYNFYSSYQEYKGELISSIREYAGGKLVKEQTFYENKNKKSSADYTDGAKELQISYNEKGEEIARMVYDNWNPVNGIEIIGNRRATYKDGKLVEEVNTYYNTQLVFSKKTETTETFYTKDGSILGVLTLNDDNGYLKPMDGERYFIDYDGDIQSAELYKDGYISQRTSYRKRQVGEKETVTFKKVEMYEPDGFKRTKEIRFYSNGNKQSEISFDGYSESKGVFYSEEGELLGAYDYKTKEGQLYEFFGDSDELKRMEVRENGKQIKLKRYDYGLNTKYGAINPVLVSDVDVSCCASFYARDGKLLGKVTFKDGVPWDGKLYDVDQRTRYTLKEGERNGLYEKLDYDQNVLETGNFVANKKEGVFSAFQYRGQPLLKETFKNDVLEGDATYYDYDGKLVGNMTYKAGKPFNGTMATKGFYNKKQGMTTYENGVLKQTISHDDNGKRVTKYLEGSKTESIAYYGDTDIKRLSYTANGSNLDGIVISYDKQGNEQHRATLENGKLKDGTLHITSGNVRGNPAYIVLNRKEGTLTVTFMGKDDKVLFKAEETLAFGTATVFMQSLDIYMDYLAPDRLY